MKEKPKCPQRFTYAEVQSFARKHKVTRVYVCTQCGYWHAQLAP